MAQSIKLVASNSEIEQYHKIGVAVPGFKNNHSFNYGRPYSSVLHLESSTGAGTVLTPKYTNPYIPQLLRVGDRITVGPSSKVGYVGATESRIISAITPYYIQVSEALNNNYEVDDEIQGIGSRFPAGWQYSSGMDGASPFSPTKLWYPYGGIYDLDSLVASSKIGDGFSNAFRLYLQWRSADGTGVSNNSPLIKRDFGNVLIGNTYYRFGCYIRVTDANFDGIRMVVNDGSSDISTLNLTYSTINTWREIKGVTTLVTTTPTQSLVTIYNNGGTSTSGYIMIDDIYMEHAKGLTSAADGVYTFTEFPELGSESITKVEQNEFTLKRTMTGAGLSTQDSGLGFGVEKFVYTMSFDNVADTFYNSLRQLINWQKRGYELVFHPNSYLTYSTKPVVYCNIGISDFKYTTFNHERVSFTLTVEEI